MHLEYWQCVQGFTLCDNKTFTNADFQVRNKYTQTLVPGFGCYLHVDRTLNGTWGNLRIKATDTQAREDLLVYDESIGE